jgi:hypothetical protein
MILWAGTAADAKYSGGTGEPNDPYQIASVGDLLALAADTNDYGKNFILVSDIDLDPNLPGGQIFTSAVIAIDLNLSPYMIFTGIPFSGVFDGNSHKIINLTIDTNGFGTKFLGLFGQNRGTIKNLGLENLGITCGDGLSEVGGIVAQNYYSGTIINCYSTGAVTDGNSSWSTGGLVGYNLFGSISNCFSACVIIGGLSSSYHGGLAGVNYGGSINGCYSTGNVGGPGGRASNPQYGFGGLVGWDCGWDGGGNISNSYSTGNVIGGNNSWCFGGLVGVSNARNISNCYSTGNVIGGNNSRLFGGLVGDYSLGTISTCYSTGKLIYGNDSSLLGGLVGDNYSGGSINDCYFLVNSGPDNGYGHPLADTQMRKENSFAGWDFTQTWGIEDNQTYPFLRTYSPWDLNRDKVVNFFDFAILASHWLEGM